MEEEKPNIPISEVQSNTYKDNCVDDNTPGKTSLETQESRDITIRVLMKGGLPQRDQEFSILGFPGRDFAKSRARKLRFAEIIYHCWTTIVLKDCLTWENLEGNHCIKQRGQRQNFVIGL